MGRSCVVKTYVEFKYINTIAQSERRVNRDKYFTLKNTFNMVYLFGLYMTLHTEYTEYKFFLSAKWVFVKLVAL